MEQILFYIFSITALLSGIMVVGARNPMHSVLFLILVFCNAAGLLILLETEFLAMLFVIVYVGAIAVLFLFVIMMLDIKLIELSENLLRYLPIGGLISLLFVVEIFMILETDFVSHFTYFLTFFQWADHVDSLSNIQVMAELLYTYYVYYFLLASVILLLAMIGAIVLTLEKSSHTNQQDIYVQLARSHNVTLYHPTK